MFLSLRCGIHITTGTEDSPRVRDLQYASGKWNMGEMVEKSD